MNSYENNLKCGKELCTKIFSTELFIIKYANTFIIMADSYYAIFSY